MRWFHFLRACNLTLLGLVVIMAMGGTSATAAPPWAKLMPFKKTEADPSKSYELTESQGPWMIMCTSFAGPDAEDQAHGLVLELRSRYHLEAFMFRQHFDFTQSEVGLGLNQYGGPKKMKNMNGYKRDEIAVLVGNFGSIEHPDVDKALQVIKFAQPSTLNPKKTGQKTNQTWANIRSYYRDTTSKSGKDKKGPMGAAFVTRNPILPEDYFAPKGLDPFIVELNREVRFSLLKCPGKYSVKVASFRGVESMKPAEFDQLAGKPREGSNLAKIDEAAVKASKLTKALRDKGVEAWEFHDRTESMVCIGSFDSVGEPRADGKIEINPAIHQIMESYGPIKSVRPGDTQAAVQVRMMDGVPFDPQPLPVEVPKQSIAADYMRRVGG